jgi:tRNA pseudouridine38-40 synthase
MPCVFERKFVHIDPREVSIEDMRKAADYMLGEHDFGVFCADKHTKKSTVRYIHAFSIERIDEEIHFTVTGNGFLHHMVRIMVGTLLEVGRGERSATSIPQLFGADRADAGELVPACGLCLMEVNY